MVLESFKSSIVKQLKAVKSAVVHLASSQFTAAWDSSGGTGRQGGRLGLVLKPSHGFRSLGSSLDCFGPSAE